MPFYLLKSSRLIAYSTPQAVQPMGSTSIYVRMLLKIPICCIYANNVAFSP